MPLSPLCWRDGHNLILYGDWLVLIWIAEVRQEREASGKLRKGSRKEGEERRREEIEKIETALPAQAQSN